MSVFNDIRVAFSRRDNALIQLLLINLLVFVFLVFTEAIMKLTSTYSQYYPDIIRQFQLSSALPELLRHPWTLLTYAFTHEGFLHILFNLMNLYFFGALLREYLGDRRLVSVYILGALLGAVLFLLAFNLIPALQHYARAGVPLIGASAGVTAVIMAATTLMPEYQFNLFLIGPVRIKYIAAFVILLSVMAINQGNPGGGIAHIGGALLGFAFVRQLRSGRDLGRPVQAVGDLVGRVFSGRPNLRVTHRGTGTAASSSSATTATSSRKSTSTKPGEDEIDLILDKISHSGYESLSKDEKRKLFQASQK